MGPPDLKKIESDGNIRKTRNVFTNLRFYGKRKKLYSTINTYVETLTSTRLEVFGLQLVAFNMLNSSRRFDVDRHLL